MNLYEINKKYHHDVVLEIRFQFVFEGYLKSSLPQCEQALIDDRGKWVNTCVSHLLMSYLKIIITITADKSQLLTHVYNMRYISRVPSVFA